MPGPSITGSVADLFATLGLDVGPLSASLAESKAMIKEAGADMSLSLGSLQARYQQVITSLTSGAEATTAYEAALQSLGITTGTATQLTAAQITTLNAERGALEQLIVAEQNALDVKLRADQERIGAVQAAALEHQLANQRIADLNQIAIGEARAAAINAATVEERLAFNDLIAAGEARAVALAKESADAQVAFANEIAAGEARADQIALEAKKAEIDAKILLANQYAEAVVRSEAIAKEAQAADALPLNLGARIGAGGIRPTVGSAAGGVIAGLGAAFVSYEAVKQFAEFDDVLNKSLSIMKDVNQFQKDEMIRTAKDLSTQYGISAVDIAHTFYTLESAGRTTTEALAEVPAVAQFAFVASADGIMKMSTAAETLTSVFNALKGSGVSIEHISDLLIKADTIAQGTGEQFAKALAGKGAGAIQILGKSAEEGLAILATMAKAGIPAAQQQAALIQLMRDLPKEAEKYQSVIITLNGHQMTFKELLYDSTGQMKDFSVVLSELETLFNGASTEVIQHDLALLHLNNRTNQSLQSMLGLSSTLADYEKQLKSAAGATKAVADIRMDTLSYQFSRLKEAARLAAIDLGEVLAPAAKKTSGLLADTIVTIHDLTQGYIGLAKAAYDYATGNYSPAPPKPPAGPKGIPGVFGSGSVEDPDADAKKKAAAERAAQERNRIQNIRLESAKKAEEELVTLEIESIKHQQALHNISDAEAEKELLAQNEKMLGIEQTYELKKLALETTKKSGVYEATVEAQASAAASRKAAADQKVMFDEESRSRKHEDAIAHYHKYIQDIEAKDDIEFDKLDLARQNALNADKAKAEDERLAGASRHATAQLELVRVQAAYEQSIGLISANQRFAIEAELDAKEEELQRKSVQARLDVLNAKGKLDVDYASKKQALENELDQLNDKRQQRELKAAIQVLKAGEDEIHQMEAKVKFEQEYGDGVVSVNDRVLRLMQAENNLAVLRGKANSEQLIAIRAQIIQNQAMIDKQHELGLMFEDTANKMGKLWNDFGDKVAEGILAGGKFWAFWHNMIHEFEVDMLKTLIHGVLKTLKDQLLAIPGVSGTLGKLFGGLGGGGSAISLGEKMGPPEATAAQVAALGANTTATVADTTTTGVNAASTDVNTGATIADAAATTANAIVTTADVISTNANTAATIGTTATQVSSRLITNGIEIQSNVLAAAQNTLISANTASILGLTTAVSADTAATTEASAQSGVESAGSAASGVGGAGTGGASSLTGWIGAISGAVTAVSSVIGNFQMAGMNKTLDLIENYTRYLKIGLVEQGDSLLNDGHVIRNTLTDMMAFLWGVQATYLQGISEKLDTLIANGGLGTLSVTPKLSSSNGAPIDIIPDGSTLTQDSSVTVDLRGSTFSGGVSDEQVTAIFNRGIDKAKRSGAFRPGTWPR